MDASQSIPVMLALGIMQALKALDKQDKLAKAYHAIALALGAGLGYIWAVYVQNGNLESGLTSAAVTYTATQAAWAVKQATGVRIVGDVGSSIPKQGA